MTDRFVMLAVPLKPSQARPRDLEVLHDMEDASLFLTSPSDALDLAVELAREAFGGEFGATAEVAYKAEFERLQEASGPSLDEIDQMGAPRTTLGRLFERLQDWWWEKTGAADGVLEDADGTLLATVFAFPVPLLRTHPIQDTPFEYAEVDQRIVEVTTDIVTAISQRTGWKPASLQEAQFEGRVFDPTEHVLAVWKTETASKFLVLVDGLEEDPKLMGRSLGLVHLVGRQASNFAEHLQ